MYRVDQFISNKLVKSLLLQITLFSDKDRDPIPLSVLHVPITCTIGFSGEKILVDPNDEEVSASLFLTEKVLCVFGSNAYTCIFHLLLFDTL